MKALVIVDVQNDFCPGGALAVTDGDAVVPAANRLANSGKFDLVVATQDWHPRGHGSFASNHPGKQPGEVVDLAGLDQILWPDHCVQDSPGAEFHPDLDTSKVEKVFRKGTDPEVDSYSAFFDNARRNSTGLGDFLRERQITDVYVCGLATDYCVKFTALDAVDLGFNTFVVEDACRGVDLKPGDVAAAIEEMKSKGASVVRSDAIAG
jgi:nicotinamidase/pyrazinamidase